MTRLVAAFADELVKVSAAEPPKAPNAADHALAFQPPAAPEGKPQKFLRDLSSPSATGPAKALQRAAGTFRF